MVGGAVAAAAFHNDVIAATLAGAAAGFEVNRGPAPNSAIIPRRGELFGLRKTDVDIEVGVIMVTRFVQQIMRHSDTRMTERYTHLDPAYLHGEMDALMRFQPAPPEPQAPEPTALAATAGAPPTRPPGRESAPFVTRLLPEAPEDPRAPLDGLPGIVRIPGVSDGAGYRVRTDDIQFGKVGRQRRRG